MLESISLGSKLVWYFDVDKQVIARKPSKSNLLKVSSDNSLYCGVVGNKESEKMLCAIFRLKKISMFDGMSMDMNGYGISCKVYLKISKQNQLQIKIGDDPVMYDLFNAFLLETMESLTNEDVLLVLDIKNKMIRFKKIKEMEL